MSFVAKLVIGKERFNVRRFSWGVRQNTDAINRPDAYVQGGQLEVELYSEPSDLLNYWALDDTKKLEGALEVMKPDDPTSVRRTIEFVDAYCVEYSKDFDGSGTVTSETDTSGTTTRASLIVTLKLSADKLICGEMTIHNEWPV